MTLCQDCSFYIRCFYKGKQWDSKICDCFEPKPLPPYKDTPLEETNG